ncbi:hypothetical protein RFI_04055, partial [Reticulomyxa filosa]
MKDGKWLSVKQLFVAVNRIAKDQHPDKLSSPVLDILLHNLTSFDDTNSFAVYGGKKRAPCSTLDKFMLIPCLNYLAFPKSSLKHNTPRFFERFLRTIIVQANDVLEMNEKDLTKALITDLQLRKNFAFSPMVRIENHLLEFLWCDNKSKSLTKAVTDILLDCGHYDKKRLNPWSQLWVSEKGWPVFQSLYQTQFDCWDKFIDKLQCCVHDFAAISSKLLKGFQTTEFREL